MEHGATVEGLPALNPHTLQKAREWAYLQRFREKFADFPEGEVVPSERPDFLIRTQLRWIGIVLTEYHVQEPDEGWGSPMRALEGTEDKVLRTGSEQYQSKGLPPVAFSSCTTPTNTWPSYVCALRPSVPRLRLLAGLTATTRRVSRAQPLHD